ncbi:hypothetical protein COHA_007806 [Chlorella ohadii]|uniref:DNA 3'-5' helicase n=1 Tax=Chlorella ohadii TaxID=2649997 RepID=A0AAD5H3U9_9CHLO|nr:hypothetical protein COHA_007806 [Chlorella ohadii]
MQVTPAASQLFGGAGGVGLPHLHNLSTEQLAAVTAPPKAIRVVAGPGSGKTRVLVARVAHLIRQHGVPPEQLLAITFTNKERKGKGGKGALQSLSIPAFAHRRLSTQAAGEMRERLEDLLGDNLASGMWCGTFHSFGRSMLKMHMNDLPGAGRSRGFHIYDTDQCESLLCKLVKDFGTPEWKKQPRILADKLCQYISRVKSSMHTWHAGSPQEAAELFREAAFRLLGPSPYLKGLSVEDLAVWFGRYEAAMREANACDFDDLIGLPVALLRQNRGLLARVRKTFKHVLVDEMQDTNRPQFELLKLLTPTGGSLFCVGDPDQSIYGWRGAELSNITSTIVKDFPGIQTFTLRDNYRSDARIVHTASAVIARNTDWQRAALRPLLPEGHPIQLLDIVHLAWVPCSEEVPAEQVAVLVRRHLQSKAIEEQLVHRNIPFRVVGGVAFWKRKEIQGIIAYLRLAVGLRDELALRDTINMPKYNCVVGSVNTAIWNIALRKLCTDEQQVLLANRRRGIGEASLQKLQDYAASRGQTLSELLFGSPGAVEDGSGPEPLLLPGHKELGISANVLAKLNSFRQLMLELHASVKMRSLDLAMGDILKKVKKTGFKQHVLSGACGKGDAKERMERVQNLVAAAKGYYPGQVVGAGPDLFAEEPAGSEGFSPLQVAQEYLTEIALYTEHDDTQGQAGKVQLMTMHAAKGLEFEVVFVPGEPEKIGI